MRNKNKFYSTDTAKKEFLKIFKELCYSRQPWEVWYTPLYFSQIWHYRRIFAKMDNIFKNTEREQVKPIPLRGGFLFEFEEEIKPAVI